MSATAKAEAVYKFYRRVDRKPILGSFFVCWNTKSHHTYLCNFPSRDARMTRASWFSKRDLDQMVRAGKFECLDESQESVPASEHKDTAPKARTGVLSNFDDE